MRGAKEAAAVEQLTGNDDFSALTHAFSLAVERCCAGASQVTLLFSGGVDSSLICRAAPPSCKVELLTIGVPGSPDVRNALESATLLGRMIRAVDVTAAEVRWALGSWRDRVNDLPKPGRDVAVGLAIALRNASHTRVLCGQGADELFFGYERYRGVPGNRVEQLAAGDLGHLLEVDWPIAQRIAADVGKELRSPYLEPSFLETVLRVRREPVAPGGESKPTLRAWSRSVGLPETVARRPKKALQYGSGISRLVKAVDRTPLGDTINR